MKKSEKISREVLNMFEYSKDVVKSNIISANSSGNVKPQLTEAQLQSLSSIIDLSISDGAHKGLVSFQRSVENIISATSATIAETETAKKKK
jgi:hypothetical protein